MEVVAFYPNEYNINASLLGVKNAFNWALYGKKVWNGGYYCLQISDSIRFYEIESGKTFLAKGNPKLLICSSTFDSREIAKKIKKEGLDGAVIVNNRLGKCLCPTKFIFTHGILSTVKSSPLIRFAKKNNSRLRSTNNKFPTCKEIDTHLKDNGLASVCKNLYIKLS